MADTDLTAQFVFTLAQASTRTVTLTWETRDGTAVENIDYVPASGQLIFAPGETSKTVTIQVLQPPTEERKFFTVAITDAVNATVDETEPGQVVIMPNNVFRGPRGFKGDRGQRGMSAYEESVANGSFVGSYADWLNFLRAALADLIDPSPVKGASLVYWDGDKISVQLDQAKKLSNYSALRAYNGSAERVEVTQSGIAGAFSRRPFVAGDTDNGGTRILSASGQWTWVREYSPQVPFSWFSTVAVGSDDTVGLTNALNYAFANNCILTIDKDVHTQRIAIAAGKGGVVCTTGVIYAHSNTPVIDVFDNMLLDFQIGVTRSEFDIVMDLQNKGASGVFVRGARNKVRLDVRNSISPDGQTKGTQGLLVSGDYSEVSFVRCTNFISAPSAGAGGMAVTVAGYAKNVQIGTIVAEQGPGGLLNNGKGTTVERIFVDGCLDNGVYDIDGAEDLRINALYAKNCPDEVACFSFSKRSRIDTIVAVNCGRGVGVTNAISPSVGEIHWRVDTDTTVDPGSPLYCRPNQTAQTNSLQVGRLVVRGTWKAGAPLFTLQNFGIGRLAIGEIDADITYTASTTQKTLGFFDSLLTSIDIGKLSVIVRDGTGALTNADIFTLNIVPNTPLASYSAIGGFHISTAGGVHSIRVPRISDPNLVVNDKIRIRADIGTPFAVNEDDSARSRDFYSGTVPTTGDWLRGDTVWKVTPGAAGYAGWICIASGTPGTWKQFGLIES